jgi:hypothetical protein
MTRVELVIDELVLTGFDPRDRHRIADALERELGTHLTGPALERIVRAAGTRDKETTLRAPDVTLKAPHRPNAIAASVSRSVVGAISAPQTSRKER